jgi:hypothetical protein
MDPYDQIYGAEPRRFMRFICEFEVEVTDPTQAAAFAMKSTVTEAGVVGVTPLHPNENGRVADSVREVVERALYDAAPEQAGFKVKFSSVLPRLLGVDGQYQAFNLPPEQVQPG